MPSMHYWMMIQVGFLNIFEEKRGSFQLAF